MGTTIFFRMSQTVSGSREPPTNYMLLEYFFWVMIFSLMHYMGGEWIYPILHPIAQLLMALFDSIPYLTDINFGGMARDFRNVSRYSDFKEVFFTWMIAGIVLIPVLASIDHALTTRRRLMK